MTAQELPKGRPCVAACSIATKCEPRPSGLIEPAERLNEARKGEETLQEIIRKVASKFRQALDSWLHRLQSIVEEGQRKAEIRSDVDAVELATLIITTLEGSLMLSRLQRKEELLNLACRHLEEHIEAKVCARKQETGARS
jgi:Tetracyclin repressor-like, C-terminal domain